MTWLITTLGCTEECIAHTSFIVRTIIPRSTLTLGSMVVGGTRRGIIVGDGMTSAGAGLGDITTIGIPAGTPAGTPIGDTTVPTSASRVLQVARMVG